jgi:hypothetical protein
MCFIIFIALLIKFTNIAGTFGKIMYICSDF